MSDSPIIGYAEGRYLNDPDFHARVDIAVATLALATGSRLSDDERSVCTLAAAVGLAMQWVDPQTGKILDR